MDTPVLNAKDAAPYGALLPRLQPMMNFLPQAMGASKTLK